MPSKLASWLLMSVAVYVTAVFLPGFRVSSLLGAVWVALLLGALQWFIGWFLFGLIGIGTLGLGFLFAFVTRLVVTAILLKFVAFLSTSLDIRSFGTAFLGALLMSAVITVAEWLLRS